MFGSPLGEGLKSKDFVFKIIRMKMEHMNLEAEGESLARRGVRIKKEQAAFMHIYLLPKMNARNIYCRLVLIKAKKKLTISIKKKRFQDINVDIKN